MFLKKRGGYSKVNYPCFPVKRGIKSEQNPWKRGYFFHQQTSVCSTFGLDCRDRACTLHNFNVSQIWHGKCIPDLSSIPSVKSRYSIHPHKCNNTYFNYHPLMRGGSHPKHHDSVSGKKIVILVWNSIGKLLTNSGYTMTSAGKAKLIFGIIIVFRGSSKSQF